ncbi:MAG: hypothetical protein IKT95_07695, partial [Spirochaetales bacterium]|nr:hypothetical protein [Spirochaetales bacterium]
MPRGLLFLLLSIAMLASVFSLVSCDNAIYMPENDTWMVQDMYFQTFDEAVTWLSSQGGSSRDIVSESRTISLMRDVSASENAGAIVVPSSFSGDLCIDFKGYGYWFGTQTQKFFEIDGGDNVQIVNQKSVIPADSGSSAKAIVVNNANVTIEGLPVDDRRPEPKAVEIGSDSSLVLKASVSGDFVIGGNGSLSIVSGEVRIGEFSMSEGATLSIEGGTVYYPHEASEAVTEAVAFSGATDVTLVTVHDITGWITTDPVVHYTECSDCHIRFEEARHVFSAWTYDPDLHQSVRVCSVCGRTETLDHEHTVVLHEAVAKTCTADGSTEYWYCPVCNLMFSDPEGVYEITATDVRIPASHNLTHVEASAATCTVDGRVEHWLCLDCGKTFTDQSAETECTGVVIPAAHQLVHHAPVAATCTEDGSVEYWSCSVCGKLFSDTLGQHEITASDLVVAKKGHSPIKREAVSPTCTTAGNTAYWVCNVCGKLFSDEACTNEIAYAETVVPALTHDVLHVPAIGATCTTAGNLEYWTCTRCGESFADSACTVSFDPSAAVIPAKGHSIVHVAAVAATCTSSGNSEYWKCTVCGKLFSDDLCSVEISIGDTVVAKKDHRLSHTAAVEPTCLSAGNIEYWTCLDCGKRFADQACTQEKTASELVLPASDHVLVHTAAVEPTCTASGNKEYWTCSECGHVFSDAGAQNMIAPYTVVLPKKGHSPVHTASLAPTCTASGNLEYWTCSECGRHFLDESCTQEVSAQALVLPAIGHDVRHVSAIAATCTSEGRLEYWYCTVCGKLWADEGLTHAISEAETVVAKLGHSLEHHAAVETGCTTVGNIEYWSCTVCGKLFGDANGVSEITPASTAIAAKGHNPQTYVAPVAATCETDGNTGYWICSDCGGLFSDAQCLNPVTLSDVTLTKTGHNAQHYDAVAATCTTAGNIEYWKCLRCGSLFSDSSCTQKITLAQTVIPALNHSFNHVEGVPATCISAGMTEHWHCTVCGKDYADSNGTVELD